MSWLCCLKQNHVNRRTLRNVGERNDDLKSLIYSNPPWKAAPTQDKHAKCKCLYSQGPFPERFFPFPCTDINVQRC